MSTLACAEYQGITLLKEHRCLIYSSVNVCDQDKDLSGLTAGFAAAAAGGGDAAAGAGAAGAAVFSGSGGFAIQLLTRPATPPLIPANSWGKKRRHLKYSNHISLYPPLSLSFSHLVGWSWTFRGAADVSFLPHVLDAACASCRNICHSRLWRFDVFVPL